MFRALLTTFLMAIIAWPQGICMCHFAHAEVQDGHCQEDATANEHSGEPEDDEDHGPEGDCTCCKLRQVVAAPIVPSSVDHRDDVLVACNVDVDAANGWAMRDELLVLVDSGRNSSFPSARMLCALRI